MAKKKAAKKNDGLTPKLIHLSEDVILKLSMKALKSKPRTTFKEYVQDMCNKEAEKH